MRGWFNRRDTKLMAVVLLFSSQVLAQKYPASFPRDGAKKVQESDNFVIWDVTWEDGKSTGMHEHLLDQVSVFLTDGAVKITRSDGTWSVEQERIGSVLFEAKGTVDAEEGVSDKPSHGIVFQLKDVVPPTWPITEGIPGQLPRAGAVKLFETNRIAVWDQTFRIGEPALLHLHYHPLAGVYLEGGKTRVISEPVDGVTVAPKIRRWEPGQIVNITAPLKAPHRDEPLEGSPRAIYVQWK
jgi:quercetin dioxygenase-like cupin family protein